MKTEEQTEQTVELYEAPAIEVTDIELEQNILGGSTDPGNDWDIDPL